MNILIVKLSALGDVLRTTSLLRPLRRRHRGCRICWLTSPKAEPLLKGNPLISRVLRLTGRSGNARDLEARLKGRFDLVLSLEEDPAASGIAVSACRGRFFGVYPRSGGLGYSASSARYYDMSLLNRDPDGGLRRANRLKAGNRLSYVALWLEVLGLKAPRDPRALAPVLRLNGRDRKAARTLARRHGLKTGEAIGLNPGAGNRWPAKGLSEGAAARLAADLFMSFGRPVILLGGREETRRNRRITEKARSLLGSRRADALPKGGRDARPPASTASRRAVIEPGTRHDLRSFAGILELCGAVAATDSLAFHMATALGRPAVVLVGPTSAHELETFGRGERVRPPKRCGCFYRSRCRFKRNCLDRLGSGPVCRALKRWLSGPDRPT